MWRQRGGGEGGVRGPRRGAGLMYKDVPQQLVSRRPLLGLYKDPFEELSAVVRHVGWEDRVGGLGGDLKDGCHRLELGPRGSLRQHLHDGAADAPDGGTTRSR